MIIADLLKKLNDTECKVPSITGLATTPAFNAVKTKMPNVSDLVKKKKKTVYDAKILDIESKYFTTSNYNKFSGDILNAKMKEKELVSNSDISGFTGNSYLN